MYLTNEQIEAIWNGMPGGHDGFCKRWGYIQFANEVINALFGEASTDIQWTGDIDTDTAILVLDRLDVAPDQDARVDQLTTLVRRLGERARKSEYSEEVLQALIGMTDATERWNQAVEKIIGRLPETGIDVARCRAVIRRATGK